MKARQGSSKENLWEKTVARVREKKTRQRGTKKKPNAANRIGEPGSGPLHTETKDSGGAEGNGRKIRKRRDGFRGKGGGVRGDF